MKRKLFKRGMLLCVCLLMVISALATLTACDGTHDSGASDSSDGNNNNVDSSSLLSVLKQGSNENLDLGGKELTISVWGEVPSNETTAFARRYAREELTEKEYNVEIEWMANNTTSFIQDVTLAYTSQKKYADLIFTPSTQGFDLCRLGAIQPLDDYIDYDNKWYSITKDALMFVDGKHYSYMPDEHNMNNLGLFITYNKTLLEIAGCDDPWTLYQEGKWDWDAFATIVEKTTIKVDDGTVKQWGVSGSNLLEALCNSNGVDVIGMDIQNGKFVSNLRSAAGLRALDFLKRLAYDYKGVDTSYGTHNAMLTFGDSKSAMMICPSYYPSKFVAKGMDVHSVPLPVGPDANGQEVNCLSLQEWWCVGTLSDFSVKDALQVALHMNDNNPDNAGYIDEETGVAIYLTEEDIRTEFLERTYDGCVFTNEYECEFYWDYMHDEDVRQTLHFATADLTAVFQSKLVMPIFEGEEPRTLLERIDPIINEALKDMLPTAMQ